MKENTNNVWIEIPNTKAKVSGYDRARNLEKSEKEKLKYWSNFWIKKNSVRATCCSF